MGTGFAVELGEIQHGWADIYLRNGEERYHANIAHGTDGLGQFLTAVSTVVTRRLLGAAAIWDDEPGLWIVDVRQHDTCIALTVDRDDEDPRFPSPKPNVVFRATFDDELELARSVAGAYGVMLVRYGAEEYERRWIHPFPQHEFDALAVWIRKEEAIRERDALELAIYIQIVCREKVLSTEISAELGEPHVRIVGILRELEGDDRLRLIEHVDDEYRTAVEIDRDSLSRHLNLRRFIEATCRDESVDR
jgi:hypothetical protein